jgi:uncharacterized LabA/DUF88 family protein
MDRYVLFVDAAYLFAAGGDLCFGTNRRYELEMKYGKAVSDLSEICRKDSGLNQLRIYWYDGARDARANWEHNRIAALPGVQVRLGRLTRGHQKGVDSRIVRDLIVLAHNRACTNAYLVSGDDDLREGVSEAQEGGVSVKLIGVEPLTGFQNQAPTLVRAADETLTLSKDQILQFLSRRPPRVAPIMAASATAAVSTSITTGASDPRSRGAEFARTWIGGATPEEQQRVLRSLPKIPGDVDYRLLEFGRSCSITLDPGSPLRIELREGFRFEIKSSIKVS